MAGFSLPTSGQPNSTEDPKILTILTGVNAIAAQYRTLLTLPAQTAGQIVNTFTFQPNGSPIATGGTSTATVIAPLELLAADHAVTGLSTKLRVKLMVQVGSTAPGTSVLTAGLYPLTISAGNWTMGTVTSGSTAASSGLAANTISRFNSGDFTFPSDGAYVLGIAVSTATVAAGVEATVQLQARNV